ncbi:hypothetical protein [Amaricoccus sp. W119]|uniref:hypothetical protein n=1 Tax=Amaricoccus sp. W119 TaxID=3391833 RepID=UPI0039A693A5
MADTDKSSDRTASLQARIDAARQRLADSEKMEWAEIGSILHDLSEDIEEARGHPPEKRDEVHDRAHRKLDEIEEKLGGA